MTAKEKPWEPTYENNRARRAHRKERADFSELHCDGRMRRLSRERIHQIDLDLLNQCSHDIQQSSRSLNSYGDHVDSS